MYFSFGFPNDELFGQSWGYCAWDPLVDPDCHRQLEEAEVCVLTFKAWKKEVNDDKEVNSNI
jgi:hypothetical protein